MGSYNTPTRIQTVGHHLKTTNMTIKADPVRIAAFSGYTGDRL
jgi:hypothetical protein